MSFSLRCINVRTLYIDHGDIKFKWDVNLPEKYRLGIAENLTKLILLTVNYSLHKYSII